MRKHEVVFLFICIITTFFIIKVKQEQIKLEEFELEMHIYVQGSDTRHLKMLYHENMPCKTSTFLLKPLAENYGLQFKDEADYIEREYIENYDVRTVKSPFPNYDKFKPVFYNIPVTGHKIMPDTMDKKHKVAIVYQKYNMYLFDDPKLEEKTGLAAIRKFPSGKTLKIFYDVDTEILTETTVKKENKYFQDLIENADFSMEVKKPFQSKDKYTVIYIERGFVPDSRQNIEKTFFPYLEKAFESLGYTKKE